MVNDLESLISLQKSKPDELERSNTFGDPGRDPNYIFRAESDLMTEGVRRSMLKGIKTHRRSQAESFVAELSTKMRSFSDEWERRFDEASASWAEEKHRLLPDLEVALATQRHLGSRIDELEGVLRE